MASRGFFWFIPLNLGLMKLLLLICVAGILGADSVIFNTNNRGYDLRPSSNQPQDYLSAHLSINNFKFAGTSYDNIDVSSHGLIYFGAEGEITLPDDLSDLAGVFPLLQRTDIRLGGSAKYLYVSSARMDPLGQTVDQALANFLSGPFVEWLVVVTWKDVQAWSSTNAALTNTFEVVLAGNDQKTFAIFNYERISWITSSFPDGETFQAQAGFVDGVSGSSYYLPGSGAHDIKFLQGKSNVGVRGRWIYDVTDFLPDVGGSGAHDINFLQGKSNVGAYDVTDFPPDVSGSGAHDITFPQGRSTVGAYDVTDFPPDVNGGVPCIPNPCENGGMCTDGECSCPVGYGGRTCEDDLSHVLCDSTSMTVVLDIRLLPTDFLPSDVHFLNQDEGCFAEAFDNHRIEISTRYDMCGTTIQEDNNDIVFQNILTFAKPRTGDGGTAITRLYHKQIEVKCCLNKISVLTGKFEPEINKININDKDMGMFSLKIARFTDEAYDVEESVDDGGVVSESRVMLGSKLYFGVVLDSTPDIGVVIKSCWATEDGPDSVPRQDLINNQCPAENTVAVRRDLPLDTEGFSFDAFRFNGETSGVTRVFIHCDVVVSSSTETAEARAEDCLSPNSGPSFRRDVSSRSRHTVSYGPVSVFSPEISFAAFTRESRSMFDTRAYLVGIVALVSMVTIWGIVKSCGSRTKDLRGERTFLINLQ